VRNTTVAIILGVSFCVGCLLLRGIYELSPAAGGFAWKVNRLTGSVQICSLSTEEFLTFGCQPLEQMTQEEADQALATRYLAVHPDEARRFGIDISPSPAASATPDVIKPSR
jgi:hypothetical protein